MSGATPEATDDVRHDRFVITEDGVEAELLYRKVGDRLILMHTGVPEAIGGRGIGGRLVQAAITRAADEGLEVVPWCPFARRWMRDHPDAVTGVTVDWNLGPDDL